MAEFFIKTEDSAVGPFTGIELREAALAGILRVDSLVGASPQGSWTMASDTGLFSEKKMPLPHPAGTHVPQYLVRGMIGALQGPFKLRELIGFAARGLLPPDATIRSDRSPEWFPVGRLNILAACLGGHLVLIDANGNVVRRASPSSPSGKPTAANSQGAAPASVAVAPAQISKSVDQSNRSAFAEDEDFPISKEPEPEDNKGKLTATRGKKGDDEDDGETEEAAETKNASATSWSRGSSLPHAKRLGVAVACLLLGVVGVAAAMSSWQNRGLERAQVVGDWVSHDFTYGISLREDGSCVVFDSRKDSWSGDFEWTQRQQDDAGYSASIAPFTSNITKVWSHHAERPIEAADGYMRFRNHSPLETKIDRKTMPDCFARRFGERLRLGYASTIVGDANGKVMYAGWMTLSPSNKKHEQDPLQSLAKMPLEAPPKVGFTTNRLPHLSVVAKQLAEKTESGSIDPESGFCYAVAIDGKYLLEHFGVPDEARPLHEFEIQQFPIPDEMRGAQMVRYAQLKLTLGDGGAIRHATLVGAP